MSATVSGVARCAARTGTPARGTSLTNRLHRAGWQLWHLASSSSCREHTAELAVTTSHVCAVCRSPPSRCSCAANPGSGGNLFAQLPNSLRLGRVRMHPLRELATSQLRRPQRGYNTTSSHMSIVHLWAWPYSCSVEGRVRQHLLDVQHRGVARSPRRHHLARVPRDVHAGQARDRARHASL